MTDHSAKRITCTVFEGRMDHVRVTNEYVAEVDGKLCDARSGAPLFPIGLCGERVKCDGEWCIAVRGLRDRWCAHVAVSALDTATVDWLDAPATPHLYDVFAN